MDEIQESRGTAGWVMPAIVILALIAVAGVGFAFYDNNNITANQQSEANTVAQLKTADEDAGKQIAALDQRLTQADAANAGLQSDISVVTKRLKLTQADLKQARDEAAQIRTDSEQKIADL